MSGLEIAGLSLKLGVFTLSDVSFAVAEDEIVVVLGPNGAGKSVLLETVAGFHRPSRGRIVIGTRDVTALPPERRRIGFLVQNFGLFAHLTVAQNVALGAKGRVENRENRPRIGDLLARFGIAHLADANPVVLSPGEKQRAALARAEAAHPDLFLLDEPFSALDAQARDELRLELGRFLNEMRVPAVFVTHDYTDVAALGDRVAVMRDGKIVQFGRVPDVFRRPVNRAAAEILGIDNVLRGLVESRDGTLLRVIVGNKSLAIQVAEGITYNDGIQIAIRAEDIRLMHADEVARPWDNQIVGAVVALRSLGALSQVTLDCSFRLEVYLMTRDVAKLGLVRGANVTALVSPSDAHVIAY